MTDTTADADTDVLLRTAAGMLRGRSAGGVDRFCAVPYAAPPFGAARFLPPQPVTPWRGERDATRPGPTAPKPAQPDVFEALLPDPDEPGTDCLTVNVWTPTERAEPLPVLVWVHGGGYVTGSATVPIYDGSAFARDGIVLVTVNYRLGVDGFALLDDAVPNRGLLDLVAALEWVRDNVAGFGGDPGRVTIAGQSAGAMAVTTLLSMPRARGLFTGVIAQSGAGHHALTVKSARAVRDALAAELGAEATAAGLARVPLYRLLSAADTVMARIGADPDPRWREVHDKIMAFQPVVDGDVLPALPVESLAAGAGAEVALLTGCTTDEFTLWTVPTGVAGAMDEAALRAAVGRLAGPDGPVDIDAVLAAYRHDVPGLSPDRVHDAVQTDWSFRIPALRAARAHREHGGRTFVYEFTCPSPLYGGRMGATHAADIAFAFDNLHLDWGRAIRGEDAPQAVADEVHAAFVAFVRSGDPGWEPFDGVAVQRVFGPGTAIALDAARTTVWDGIR